MTRPFHCIKQDKIIITIIDSEGTRAVVKKMHFVANKLSLLIMLLR